MGERYRLKTIRHIIEIIEPANEEVFGIYRIVGQRKLNQAAYANAQTHQSIHSSSSLNTSVWTFKEGFYAYVMRWPI